MDRCIFHVDVNSAFLSWSAVKRLKEEPTAVDLRTIPSAVGGDIKTRHGVITAKSLPAKKLGIHTGEPVSSALGKCPSLVLVKSDFQTYRQYSQAFIRILQSYSDAVEQVSIDEAFLDMSADFPDSESSPAQLQEIRKRADAIRNEIRTRLGFTVNIGISTNKLLAKMASDFEKPDKLHTLWPWEIPEKLWPLPIGSLHGCGRSSADALSSFGIRTIGDAAHSSLRVLRSILGEKAGAHLLRSANGISNSPVRTAREAAKSYSNERTTAEDIGPDNYEKLLPPLLQKLSDSVAKRMQRDEVRAFTVGVMVKTNSFHRHSRQTTLERSCNDATLINSTAELLMKELLLSENGLFRQGDRIRLVGVSAQNLDHSAYEQLSLFDWAEKHAQQQTRSRRDARLSEMMQKLNSRYGAGTVTRGTETEKETQENT